MRLWETGSGRCIHALEGPGEAVEWLTWHPRGDVILAGSEDMTSWMWNAQNGACMQVCCSRSYTGQYTTSPVLMLCNLQYSL